MSGILTKFRNNIISFFDELIEQFPNEPDFVIIRFFLKDKIPPEDIISYFIQKVLPDKQLVVNRDEKFFTETNSLFGLLPEAQANTFKRIWKSPSLDKDDRMAIWKWVDTFIFIAESYQKSLVDSKRS